MSMRSPKIRAEQVSFAGVRASASFQRYAFPILAVAHSTSDGKDWICDSFPECRAKVF